MVLLDYLPNILKGAWLSIQVALLSLMLSTLIGIFGALAKRSSFASLRIIFGVYTTVIRGVPELVLMLLIFFGGQIAVNRLVSYFSGETYVDVNPFVTGVLTIGVIYGAYMVETFRGAIQSIKRGSIETAHAFGFSPWQTNVHIIFPQMMLHALPGFTNNWLVLLKSTALVSVIGLDDMVRIASLASGSTQQPFIFYITVAIIFLMFTWFSLFVLRKTLKHYKIEGGEVLDF